MALDGKRRSKRGPHSDFQVLTFVVALCFTCAFLLAIISYALSNAQTAAKEFDRSKQMLIAAKILNHKDEFEILTDEGKVEPARFDEEQQVLVPVEGTPPKATEDQIKQISEMRIRPLFTNKEGKVFTQEEEKIELGEYLEKYKKTGYANQPYKLLYAILPNEKESTSITDVDVAKDLSKAVAFVIPVSGFGLWAPIYGYIALEPTGDEVIGTTWYEMAETPGLGANITEAWWQNKFFGKLIFHEAPDGNTDFATADMGITIVKGKVSDVYGTTPRAKSAVDGISGATLTGDGVTQAYRNSLTPYRQFFINLRKDNE